MKEEWKDIAGYEGLYQVSNKGRIRSLDRTVEYKNGTKHFYKGRILKQFKDKDGYLKVNLMRNGTLKRRFAHRLVALKFIPNPDNKPQVNHIDGCKSNNCVSNLEWNTCSENIQHSFKNGFSKLRMGTERYNAKFTEEQVKTIRKKYKSGDNKYGCHGLAKKYNVCADTIWKIVTYKKYKNVE